MMTMLLNNDYVNAVLCGVFFINSKSHYLHMKLEKAPYCYLLINGYVIKWSFPDLTVAIFSPRDFLRVIILSII